MAKRIPLSFIALAVAKQLTTTNPMYDAISDLIYMIEHDKRYITLKDKLPALRNRLVEIDEELGYE
jgi:hypothetical protein